MDVETATILVIGVIFVSIIGYKSLKNYNSTEVQKHSDTQLQHQTRIIYEKEIEKLTESNKNYKNKIRSVRDNYDLNYEDVDFEEGADSEFRLSELAQSIYPKLPPSLGKLIDKEEFQNAIIKTVDKNPDMISKFVDKFIGNKTEDNPNNKLDDTYL